MKKSLFTILFTFFSFNIFAQEIKFSMYNDMKEVCPKAEFYVFTINEFCRPVSPAGKAVIQNTTIKEAYKSLVEMLTKEMYTPYKYLEKNLPDKSMKQTIKPNKEDKNYQPEYVSIKGDFPELYGSINYKIAKDKAVITMVFNKKIKGTIEFIQQGKDVVINKDTEYMDFMVDNKYRTAGGMPVSSNAPNKNTSLHSIYEGGSEIWVDSEFLAPVTFPSGKTYKNVNIALHKNVKKLDTNYESIGEFFKYEVTNKLKVPVVDEVIETDSARYEFKWTDTDLFVKEEFLEAKYTFYYKITADNNGIDCTLLIFD